MLRAQAQSQSQSQSQSQMLLGSLPGSCSDLSQFVSLSASRVGDEIAGAGSEGQLLFTCRWLAFAFVTHLFWFVYHCDLYFFVFFSLPAPLHPFSPFSSHFVSHFSYSFNLENSEKRAQSNKIKLGFIDPFQFDSLTPPLPSPLYTPFSLSLFFCSSSSSPAHPLAVLSVLLLCNN